MHSTDAFLLIDANIQNSPFFPSKLVEYFAFTKPIIAITPENSETHKLLKETGHFLLQESNLNIIPEILIKIKSQNYKINTKITQKYELSNILNMWKDIIN